MRSCSRAATPCRHVLMGGHAYKVEVFDQCRHRLQDPPVGAAAVVSPVAVIAFTPSVGAHRPGAAVPHKRECPFGGRSTGRPAPPVPRHKDVNVPQQSGGLPELHGPRRAQSRVGGRSEAGPGEGSGLLGLAPEPPPPWP